MGHRSILAAKPPASVAHMCNEVRCEQAIFTSVRTATGQGYQLIASSSGICAEEKVEITRRSASHESLCATDAEPVGLMSYRLSTGRHCITYCCHAGCEHTARGGQRVYSHIIVLEPENYRQFHCDPVGVHRALAQVVTQNGPQLKPPPRLEPLTLTIPSAADSLADLSEAGLSEWVPTLAAGLLTSRRLIFVGAPDPLRLLRLTLLCLPVDVRETVDVSCDLKFSPARNLQLILIPQADLQLRRLIAGQDIELRRADTLPPDCPPACGPWFRLLSRWWLEGRLADLARLTSNVCADAVACIFRR